MRDRSGLYLAATLSITLIATAAHADQSNCGQPVTSGSNPTATDCLYILKTAVGAQTCSPECICDVNAAGGVTATDALTCLKKAVGQNVTFNCPCATTTTSTTLPGPCDLFVNGGFEDPVQTSPQNGWSFADVDGAGGWKSSGGNPGGYFTLNAAGQLDTDPTVSQTVGGLSIGATYQVRGEYRSFANSYGAANKPDAFAVRVEPQPSDHASTIVLALPRPSPDDLAWTAFTVDFVAAETTATVSFLAERDGDDSSFDVDNLCLGAR